MSQPIFLVDAFAHAPFTGNPAAVCPLEKEPEKSWMQSVAMEMNQAETAFFWPEGDSYRLRWFTPAVEVDLCGHATLASAHVLFEKPPLPSGGEGSRKPPLPSGGEGLREVRFQTRSGELVCTKTEDGISMDFPNEEPSEVEPFTVADALGVQPVWMGANRMDWFFVLESPDQLLALKPDLRKVAALGKRGVIVTAQGSNLPSPLWGRGVGGEGLPAPAPAPSPDFLSRFFAPQSGIGEDPVTGSAHCALGPFWADRLGKTTVTGYQASKRGGFVTIDVNGPRVALTGRASTVFSGTITA